MPSALRALAALPLLFALSCSRVDPGAVQGEVTLVVLAYDAGTGGGAYRLVKARLTTLHSLRTMDGDAAKLLGGAKIVIDPAELAQANPQTGDDVAKVTLKSPGTPVDFAGFDVDGTIHPEDFHSLHLATTYYNFERAFLFFQDLNAALYNMPVQYQAQLTEGTGEKAHDVADNAFWDPITRQFIVLPWEKLDELPLGMNVGVIGHEYAHAVFTTRFFPSGEGLPWLLRKSWAEPDKYKRAMNLEKGFDEGLADVFGAFISNDPNFLRKSIPDIAEARRLDPDEPRCFTDELAKRVETTSGDAGLPYAVGSVLSAALWQGLSGAGDRQSAYAQGLVDAMTELGARFKQKDADIALADAVDAIVSTMSAGDLKPKACGLLLDRFGLSRDQVPSCGQDVRPPDHSCH